MVSESVLRWKADPAGNLFISRNSLETGSYHLQLPVADKNALAFRRLGLSMSDRNSLAFRRLPLPLPFPPLCLFSLPAAGAETGAVPPRQGGGTAAGMARGSPQVELPHGGGLATSVSAPAALATRSELPPRWDTFLLREDSLPGLLSSNTSLRLTAVRM